MQVPCNMNVALFPFNRNCWQSSVRDNRTLSILQNEETEDKKNKKKRERKELYLSEGKYTWLQLHFYRAYLKNSSNVPVFNTDALMMTNCKEKQGKKVKRIKEPREVEHQMVKGNS